MDVARFAKVNHGDRPAPYRCLRDTVSRSTAARLRVTLAEATQRDYDLVPVRVTAMHGNFESGSSTGDSSNGADRNRSGSSDSPLAFIIDVSSSDFESRCRASTFENPAKREPNKFVETGTVGRARCRFEFASRSAKIRSTKRNEVTRGRLVYRLGILAGVRKRDFKSICSNIAVIIVEHRGCSRSCNRVTRWRRVDGDRDSEGGNTRSPRDLIFNNSDLLHSPRISLRLTFRLIAAMIERGRRCHYTLANL